MRRTRGSGRLRHIVHDVDAFVYRFNEVAQRNSEASFRAWACRL